VGWLYMAFIMLRYVPSMRFPSGSDGKESACYDEGTLGQMCLFQLLLEGACVC